MTVRRFPGIITAGGPVFWTDVVNEKGWRIQYNKTADTITPFKAYRLLDPKDVMWASADSTEELANDLPNLIDEMSKKDPLVDKDDLKRFLAVIGSVAMTAAAKGKVKSGK